MTEPEEVPFEEETITQVEAKSNLLVLENTTTGPSCQVSPSKENQNPMERTNQFQKAKQTGMLGCHEEEVEDDDNVDIEETAVKGLLSPTIHQQQNQTHTTNKFSNFGFFAGSPR